MNPILVRAVIYPGYRLIKRDEVSAFAVELERTQWLSRPEILEYQWEKLRRLIDHAYRTVPYYRKVFDLAGIGPDDIQSPDDLKKLSPLTKDAIRANSDSLLSSEATKERLRKDSTGGSTGDRLWFYTDDRSCQMRQNLVHRGDSWCGARLGDRQATLWGAAFDLKTHQKLAGRLRTSILNLLFLSTYNLTDEKMAEYAAIIERFKPKLLTSYPTPLVTFAEFLQANPRWKVQPGAIISSSETLFGHQRTIIEQTFGCRVFNRYGTREFGAIAHECDIHAGMHINTERLFVEFIKEDGSDAAPGETGEILITDLDNYGMPFIRYKIEDMAVPTDRICSCGRGLPMIEKVEGRVFDVIVTPSGAHFPGTFWTFLTRAIPGITKFQVVQRDPALVQFKIVPGAGFQEGSLDKLRTIVSDQTRGELRVDFEIVDSIPLTRSGKHRFIISDLGKKE